MKYDCPKCKRNLKGEDLWLKQRLEDEAAFGCPGCGAKLRITAHAAEVWAGLFAVVVMVALVVTAHAAFGVLGAFLVLIGIVPALVGVGSWLHRNKQRYQLVDHAV
jgi:hypothetical protein